MANNLKLHEGAKATLSATYRLDPGHKHAGFPKQRPRRSHAPTPRGGVDRVALTGGQRLLQPALRLPQPDRALLAGTGLGEPLGACSPHTPITHTPISG